MIVTTSWHTSQPTTPVWSQFSIQFSWDFLSSTGGLCHKISAFNKTMSPLAHPSRNTGIWSYRSSHSSGSIDNYPSRLFELSDVRDVRTRRMYQMYCIPLTGGSVIHGCVYLVPRILGVLLMAIMVREREVNVMATGSRAYLLSPEFLSPLVGESYSICQDLDLWPS